MFEQTTTATPQRSLRYPVIVELLILGVIVVVLTIGLWMIDSLAVERSSTPNPCAARSRRAGDRSRT